MQKAMGALEAAAAAAVAAAQQRLAAMVPKPSPLEQQVGAALGALRTASARRHSAYGMPDYMEVMDDDGGFPGASGTPSNVPGQTSASGWAPSSHRNGGGGLGKDITFASSDFEDEEAAETDEETEDASGPGVQSETEEEEEDDIPESIQVASNNGLFQVGSTIDCHA
jgi:hypothetical protein